MSHLRLVPDATVQDAMFVASSRRMMELMRQREPMAAYALFARLTGVGAEQTDERRIGFAGLASIVGPLRLGPAWDPSASLYEQILALCESVQDEVAEQLTIEQAVAVFSEEATLAFIEKLEAAQAGMAQA